MPYQSVGTPKFFIDHALWLHHSGIHWELSLPEWAEVQTLNPSNTKHFTQPVLSIFVPQKAPINYVAYLGHDIATQGGKLSARAFIGDTQYIPTYTNTVNINSEERPEYDGFSISEFTNDPDWTEVYGSVNVNPEDIGGSGISNLGAVSIGSTYTMPNAPNLSLTMSRDYGGTKEFTTYNGSSMSNTLWNKAPKWGAYGAWELGNSSINQAFARSGRRSWSLKFSYMDDGDLWGSNQSLSIYIGRNTGIDSDDINGSDFQYNLLNDDNFFSQVWHKTLGGTLPFIFQPNKDDNIDYAICKFVDNSLKATPSAFNVYDISLKLEEAW